MSGPKKGTYLENYLESVSSLPTELRRNFALMRELDVKSEELLQKISNTPKIDLSCEVTGEQSKTEKRNQTAPDLSSIREDFSRCLDFSDEKVSLALQAYELVDKHIRRLDTELKKFEAELEADQEESSKRTKRKTLSTSSLPFGEGKGPRGKGNKTQTSVKRSSVSVGYSPTGREDQKRIKLDPSLDARVLSVDLDMPIDPNEPTYCVCNRVSFGEMVGCDNPDCRVEWFHFECVGLTHPPKGRWYCPECRNQQKKRTS